MIKAGSQDLIQAPASKVVHFFSSASGYRWFLDQILTLKAGGTNVECVIGQEGWLTEQLRANDIPTRVFDLSLPWSLRDLRDLPSRIMRFANLLEFLESQNYSASQSHLFESAVIGRLAAWIVGIPTRIRMSETPSYLMSAGARRIELALQRLDTHTVASSELIRSQYLEAGLAERSVSVIYYGASRKTFSSRLDPVAARKMLWQTYGIPSTGPLIGMVAHFYAEWLSSDFTVQEHWGIPVKLHTLFIDAAEVVLKTHPDAIFVLAGSAFTERDREYYGRVQEYVNRRGLDKSVFFTGMMSKTDELLSSLDLSVQCSSFDNLGGVLEAMAMACPVIATNVGAFSEAVQNGENGYLVDKKVSDLSEKILFCLNNPDFAKLMGRRGQLLVNERFKAEQSAEKLRALYHSKRTRAGALCRKLCTALRTFCILPLIAWVIYRLCHCDIMSRLSQINLQNFMHQLRHWQKRLVDLFVSITVLSALSPFVLIIGLLNRYSRPLLFKYMVSGKDARAVEICTWWPMQMKDNNTLGPLSQNLEDRSENTLARLSARIRHKFWWLPLMFSVFMGRMSLIGPCLRASSFQSNGQSWQICRPGILGWTQSMNEVSSEETELRDSLYAVTFGPMLDLKIVLKCLIAVFRPPNAKPGTMKAASILVSDVRESVG